ncbi:dihydropteroate synthase [Acidisoma cellulosilytica]|uniref:Dihydropteroate synthase n=1 Tax=Acidisoma cellulosilyticum TaxID=2802395 RepID=A0A964E6E6_9PROT|nr:dihydropteroate synthase [Acidisoma cellulosilyticum]MCB8883486.1 dihydropteroate synthase [Acidisoma cellulosilyticum]
MEPRRPSHWAGLTLDRPLIMGILNVTPDSFSDGGRHFQDAAALVAGQAMLAAGADILDIGGESTRPGALPVDPAEECRRILPAIRALAERGAVISVDTRNASTMAAALDAGARIVNDVTALAHDPAALKLVADRCAPTVLMHMRGTPATMNDLNRYRDIGQEVADELGSQIAAAMAAGLPREAIVTDPGFGFAKVGAQNIDLMRNLAPLRTLGFPMLIGLSRKGFIGQLSGEPVSAQRLGGSLAAALFALTQGAAILRVHDVPETVQAVRVWQGLSV